MPTRGFDIIKEEIGGEPVTIGLLRKYAEIRSESHDDLLNELFIAARQQVEKFLCLSLVETDITVRLEQIEGSEELPYGPVIALTSVKDEADADVDYTREGLIGSFVGINTSRTEPTVIKYKAGYAADKFPYPIKLSIMKLTVDNFEQRAGFAMTMVQKLPNDWKANCRSYRRIPWTA